MKVSRTFSVHFLRHVPYASSARKFVSRIFRFIRVTRTFAVPAAETECHKQTRKVDQITEYLYVNCRYRRGTDAFSRIELSDFLAAENQYKGQAFGGDTAHSTGYTEAVAGTEHVLSADCARRQKRVREIIRGGGYRAGHIRIFRGDKLPQKLSL